MQLAIVIQDRRMQWVYDLLQQRAAVFPIRKSYDFVAAKQKAALFDAVILGMSGLDDQGELELAGQRIPMIELLRLTKMETYILTGRDSLILKELNRPLINFSDDPKIKAMNADLTAQGVLDLLIMQTPRDFRTYRYDILGYGACGKALAQLLSKNDCQLRVITRQTELKEKYLFLDYPQWSACPPGDILINTAAACVINTQTVKKWLTKPLIIDLASQGIGVEKILWREWNVRHVPGLPALTGPETAARYLIDKIEKELNL